MLALILVVLFVPLSRALMHVRNETLARAAIRDAVRQLALRDAIVSAIIDLAPDRIRARLIMVDAVPDAKTGEARKTILKRTGRDVDLFVRKVAGEEEPAPLRERLKPALPAPREDLDSVRRELVARLEQPIQESWPAGSATLLGYKLGFSPSGIIVRLRYQAPVALDEVAAAILRKVFQSRFHVEQLRVEMDWTRPEPPPLPAKMPKVSLKEERR